MKGIEISKPGIDIFSGKPEEKYVQPDTAIFKIALKGDGTVTFNSDLGQEHFVDIEHGLGYIPHYVGWTETQTMTNRVRLITSSTLAFVEDTIYAVAAANTEIVRMVFRPVGLVDPTGTYRYYYHIYFDPLL